MSHVSLVMMIAEVAAGVYESLISKVVSLCVTFNKRGCSGWKEKMWVTDEG